MIRRIDDSIADILHTLQDLGIDNNTICVFSSDNGPHNEGNNPRTFESFANMEGIKRDMWEAGIRAPTIVRWPGHIAGATGNENNIHEISYPSALWDWMPTFCELANVPAPAWCDGVSLVPTLTGTGTQRDKGYLYFEFQSSGSTPNWAEFPNHGGDIKGEMQCLRIGDHMGIRTGITTGSEPFKIYNVTSDPGEATNLAASLPMVQSQMQSLALTARRPGGGVSRLYDGLPLPAVTSPPSLSPGLSWKSYTDPGGTWQWVPEFRDLTAGASGTANIVDLSVRPGDDNFGLLFTGYLNVATAGSYTFYLDSDTGADFFLHDGHLIDDDFAHSGSVTSTAVNLSVGLHPFRLYYRHATGSRNLALDWSGPGLSRQAVPQSAYFTEGTTPPGPPVATNDTATTAFETPVLIDVLANDIDDGTPGPMTLQSVGTPDFGTAAVEAGKVRYSPPVGFSGAATFSYVITDGANTDNANVTVTVQPAGTPLSGTLWTTTFTGSDGTDRALTNTNGAPAFTDSLTADDANLTFEDITFTGTVFMHSGDMASGNYYSPRTNVDSPAAGSPQNGGWWQSEFRYTGGSQSIDLTSIAFNMAWSNSSGIFQTNSETIVRDITLTVEYSLNGGASWGQIASPQNYDLTEPNGEDQLQVRTFIPASAIRVQHSNQDLWLRVRAENANGTAGAYVDIKSIEFVGIVLPDPVVLWTTTFSASPASDGNNRNLTNTNGDPSFTDTLSADDANLTFQDITFTGTVFMNVGTMASGTYYSPRTNVDNPGAAIPQNGGWWQTEFRYTGGSQMIGLSDIAFNMLWSNSSGNLQTTSGASIRDITLTAEYSLNDGANWIPIASPQTFDLTEPNGEDQFQWRTFTPASAILIDHSTQDLWLRVRAENAGTATGAYADIQSIAFRGNIMPPVDDYTTWAAEYPGANLTDPDADLDGDGMTNFEERAFGLNPTSGSSVNPITIPLNGAFTYTRRDPSLTGLSYTVWTTTNLQAWSPGNPDGWTEDSGAMQAPGVPDSNGVQSVSVTLSPGLLTGEKLFVRVRASN